MNNIRLNSRRNDELRKITIEKNIVRNADGSCLIKAGNTHVLCTATIDEKVPPFLRNTQTGWITAEYSMIPASGETRIKRDSQNGKISGRTHEIQRLIGRSFRAITDLKILGERQIIIDCDVINADGGTRTASITGSYVALSIAINKLLSFGVLKTNPISTQVAAISCGIVNNEVLLDMDYSEDSIASVDANFIYSATGNIVELQVISEKKSFNQDQLFQMLEVTKQSMKEIFEIQRKILSEF
jgi:ribonuclease PH